MKIFAEVHDRIVTELPLCKTHEEVYKLFLEGEKRLIQSSAPYDQKLQMWIEMREHLTNLTQKPSLIDDAHRMLDIIIRRQV